jgi:acrylyl-CoA reductase (NADPH)
VPRAELAQPAKLLAKERWAGGVDAVGSHVLANLLSMTKYGGAVAACGLAGGMDLPTSVAPFILRGVKLYGIESVYCPQPKRGEAWKRLARDLPLDKLDAMTSVRPLKDAPQIAAQILQGQVRGRTVIDLDA